MKRETLFERIARKASEATARRTDVDLFHRIDDAEAIVRIKGGIFKQTEVYRRGERIYVKHGSGFVRLCAHFGESYGTSSPSVNVIEITKGLDGLSVDGEPRWTGRRGA